MPPASLPDIRRLHASIFAYLHDTISAALQVIENGLSLDDANALVAFWLRADPCNA